MKQYVWLVIVVFLVFSACDDNGNAGSTSSNSWRTDESRDCNEQTETQWICDDCDLLIDCENLNDDSDSLGFDNWNECVSWRDEEKFNRSLILQEEAGWDDEGIEKVRECMQLYDAYFQCYVDTTCDKYLDESRCENEVKEYNDCFDSL